MALQKISYAPDPAEPMGDAFGKINVAIDQINTLEPIGVVHPYLGVSAPNVKYLVCQGQAISRTTYAALFALISTNYGSGDGSTTFNLPNLKGRFLVGYDPADIDYNGMAAVKSGGEKTHLLSIAEMPSHFHSYIDREVRSGSGALNTPTGAATTAADPHNTDPTGGGLAHENRPPYMTINYIIRAL